MKRLFVILLVVAAVASGFYAGRASADQPMMQSALEHLRAARADLQRATNDKGGHRESALRHTNQAIDQVEKGIRFDRRR
jgi:hypothetical protein